MASKETLAKEALALASALGESVEIADLDHAALTELVKDLQEKHRAAQAKAAEAKDEQAVADAANKDKVEKDRAAAVKSGLAKAEKRDKLFVSRGHALYCRRGLLAAGAGLRPGDFSDGELERLLRRGAVTDKKPEKEDLSKTGE